MNRKLKGIIEADIARYGNVKYIIKPLYLRWQITYRKASFYSRNSFIGVLYRMRLLYLSERSGIQISTAANIGKGLFLGHTGRIIVNPDAVIGTNVNIGTGVTIGKANRGQRAGVPIIGNDVWIGTNAVIVGKITIGDDVLIAPNSYVNIDIPSHSIVLGNPAIIHPCENATESYINNKYIESR